MMKKYKSLIHRQKTAPEHRYGDVASSAPRHFDAPIVHHSDWFMDRKGQAQYPKPEKISTTKRNWFH